MLREKNKAMKGNTLRRSLQILTCSFEIFFLFCKFKIVVRADVDIGIARNIWTYREKYDPIADLVPPSLGNIGGI